MEETRGVEKTLERQPAFGVPRAQLGLCGAVELDIAQGVGGAVCVEQGTRRAAGAARGIADEEHDASS